MIDSLDAQVVRKPGSGRAFSHPRQRPFKTTLAGTRESQSQFEEIGRDHGPCAAAALLYKSMLVVG